MDAYSYLFRGQIFANAQTGNLLLFGTNLAQGCFIESLHYLLPACVFVAGIIVSDMLKYYIPHRKPHWRQVSIAIEMIMLVIACFVPKSMNMAANALISFGCGLQVESFRTFRGNAIATTMCIGNLRTGTNHLDRYVLTKDIADMKLCLLYYSTIVFFVIGAVIEAFLLKVYADKALLFSVFILAIVFLLMMRGIRGESSDIKTH